MSLKTKVEAIEKRFELLTGNKQKERRKQHLDEYFSRLNESQRKDFIENCSDEDLDLLIELADLDKYEIQKECELYSDEEKLKFIEDNGGWNH